MSEVDSEGLIFRRVADTGSDINNKANPIRGAGSFAESVEANQRAIEGNGIVFSISRLGAAGANAAGVSSGSGVFGNKGGSGSVVGLIAQSGGGGSGASSRPTATCYLTSPGGIGTAFSGGSGSQGFALSRADPVEGLVILRLNTEVKVGGQAAQTVEPQAGVQEIQAGQAEMLLQEVRVLEA